MTCSKCGTENKPGRRFCVECGAPLAAACPSCGAPVEAGEKFCGTCGNPLVAAPGATRVANAAVPAAPEAERRLVSVLFADLVGFTPFAEERDAEDVRDTLSRYFEIATDVITRYGGTVEKFIGDAVMAVWGAPVAHEDDAERAVRAALELVDSVRALGPEIQARAGVLTGEAAVTIGATNQGMVAGDLVNTAARLQSVAPPGAVLVGDATHRAASKAIAFEEAGEQLLKGKASPVAAWRALRVVAERGGRNRAEMLEAPFAGRDDELRLLKDLFHATGRERRARLVSVTGIGGIGKSRLAWEFLKYLDGLVESVWWHQGRSPAYGEGITFWALGEMVRGRAGLLESDDEATTRAKVAATVSEHVPDAEERRWIEPALLALLGIEAGAIPPEQLVAGWRAFFERLSASATVIMVFEDLQWADSGLIDFIDQLLEWSRAHPIYVVTLARPELLDRRPDWGAGKRSFSSLYLEPLPEPAMRQLLAGLVPGLPEPTVRAIVTRADGVPLYAVETVRMLLADGKLAARPDGTYAPTSELVSLAVPESLTALIAARLDGLEPGDRSLLQDAAVLGQSFTPVALAVVAGSDEASLEPRLRALVRRELLALAVDSRSPERGQYAFVQALIREVAYNTLARRERKAKHLAAARYFEGVGSEEIAGALAGHYLAAHENASEGPEAEALAVQARIALGAAAERAAMLGSHEQARTFIAQALSVTSDAADEADLLERSGRSAAAIQRFDEAEAALQTALERRTSIGDRIGAAAATAELGRILLHAYRFEAALGLLESASTQFTDLAADPAVITLDGQLARAYFLHDEHRRAADVAERVLAAAEQADLVDVVSDTLVTKGSALVHLGRRREGMGLIEIGRELAEREGLLVTVGRALNNLASYSQDDDPRAGLEAARAGMALARRLGARNFNLLDNAFSAAFRIGDWEWALPEVDAARSEETDPLARAVALADTLQFMIVRGQPTATLFAELEAIAHGAPDTDVRAAPLWWARGFEALSAGRYQAARTHFGDFATAFGQGAAEASLLSARAALWARDGAGAAAHLAAVEPARRGRAIDADRAVIRAGIAALAGRPDEALVEYRPALRTWRDLGCVWDEALCAIDMALLLDPGNSEVRATAESARQILGRLGAQPFLERLESALGRVVAPGPHGSREPSPEVEPAVQQT
ncbi:MAG: adenylate/guanylate cyclase domain-containing protein [Candidatus Limnocylindrales bacterium]